MYRWFLALRYLMTRPINLLGMVGVMLGVWALIVVVSIFSGFLQVIRTHVKSANADLSVLALPESTTWPQVRSIVLQDPNVATGGCAPRLVQSGLLHRPGERPGPLPLPGRGALQGGDGPYVTVLGVDAAAERGVTGFADWVDDSGIPDDLRVADKAAPLQDIDGLPAILLGLSRLQQTGLHRGDHLVFTSGKPQVDARGETRAVLPIHGEFVVAGAFHTLHSGFDGNNVFVHIDRLRQLVRPGHPDAVLEVAVHVEGDSQLEATAERLQRSLHRDLGLREDGPPVVWSWEYRDRLLLLSVAHQRELMKVVLIVIMVVAAFLMLATLLMMVSEKTGDIGILCAMGGTAGGVTQLFLCCGLVITGIGIVLGIATGCLTAVYLDSVHRFLHHAFGIDLFPIKVYNLDRVPYQLDPWWIAAVAGIALSIGAVVSAVPAWLAGRHNPLQSLRGL